MVESWISGTGDYFIAVFLKEFTMKAKLKHLIGNLIECEWNEWIERGDMLTCAYQLLEIVVNTV